MRAAVVCIEDVKNQDKWRFRTKVSDPKQLKGKQRRRRRRNIRFVW